MGDLRIKGQDVEVGVVIDGRLQASTADVKSCEFAFKLSVQEEGYLGEKTNRYDMVFSGIRGRMEIHSKNVEVFDVVEAIVNKAKNRTPGVTINVKATLNFPNGQRARLVFRDVAFGEIPFNVGDRASYVSGSLEFQGSDFNRL